MVVSGLVSAHIISISVIVALLLDRGVSDSVKKTQIVTSDPWLPSGPPPTKPPMDEEASKALQKILPLVTFDCKGKTGYFPDSQFQCAVFHYCKPDGTRNSFHCPRNSLFNQLTMVCEEKTAFNTRLCKEGSIGAKKEKANSNKQSPKKYLSPNAPKHPQTRPAASTNHTKPDAGYVMTLEDLLGYMNSNDRNSASSGFHQRGPVGTLVKLPPPTEKKVVALKPVSQKPFSKLVNTTVVVRKETQKRRGRYDDVSIEYDAIEGRKRRKHVRVGRVLDVDVATPVLKTGKPHSHVSARSPTESPPDVTTMTEESTTTVKSNTSGPSLFSADRSKAKDIRKRRRNLNRRKKLTTDNSTTEMVPKEGMMTSESVRDVRRGPENTTPDYSRPKLPRTEKEDQESEMSQSWLGYSQSGKVVPYTLPPLPMENGEQTETTTQSTKEPTKFPKRKRTDLSGRKKNQWYKTTPVPGDEFLGSQYGEKIADTDHKTTIKTKRPSEYENSKMHSEEDRSEYTRRPKNQDGSNYEEKRFFHFPLPSSNREQLEKSPQEFFPPPRAEPRELSPSHLPASHLYESSAEKPTTENPYPTTPSYELRPNMRMRDQQDKEQQWTLSADKRKRKKIQVGSTFSSHGAEATTESSVTEAPPSGRRGLPKVNTEAHQHLLKLMNEFFAMSSIPKDPIERATDPYKSIELDPSAISIGRTSEEDMVAGSETVTDEMEELPSELLDVVDFLAGHSKEEEEEKEPDVSHEVIRINGPITNAHLKEILSNDEFEFLKPRKKARKESVKKIVMVPSEEKENYRDISEIARFASTRLKPKYNMKHASSDKPHMTVIPLNSEPPKPSVVSAKKIPIRVIYKDHVSEPSSPRVVKQPNMKVIRSRLPKPSFQVIQNGKITPTRQYSQPHPKPRVPAPKQPQPRPKIVIQPKSVFPPHPPPLSAKNQNPFRFGFPFSAGSHPLLPHLQYRRKRSTPEEADRRQARPQFMPFPRHLFPGFNPKFTPNFTPFKNIFSQTGLHPSGSSVSPFAFPGPQFRAPPIFKPNDPHPQPVRHVTQNGHQTVIVEEVPVPIHVEVPDPNMLRPAHPGNLQKNINPFPGNQFRSPSPPAITTPPLVHSFQGSLPGNPNYRPIGMPSNVRPPMFNYQPSLPFSPPLPPSITNQGQVYALGVTNKPFGPVTGKTPGPFQHFNVHANAYPNFPYFQGAFTTPLEDDSVPGRVMFSGYKPPKTTAGGQLRTTSMPKRDKKENYPRSSKSTPPRPKPTQSYYHVTNRPTEYVSYNSPTRSVLHSSPNGLREQNELRSVRPSYNMDPTPVTEQTKRRRPHRRRRPRPRTTTTTPTVHVSKNISPTPPPPEQIPPPPSEFTALPLKQDFSPIVHSSKAVSTNIETSSLYPPAGYYGKDQLGQFFDSSSKSYKKVSSSRPYEHNDLGETTSSAEVEESVTSLSSEDPDQPAFGTRLRSKSQGQRRRKKIRQEVQSPTQKTEVRVRATASPEEVNRKKEPEQQRSRSYRKHENRENPAPAKRQRPAQYRSRSRPSSNKPEVNSYRYDDNHGFYSVPTGIQGLVDPSQVSGPTNGRGNTDMFGIPHPEMDSNIYSSLRSQGAPGGGFSSGFFSVPKEVQEQQQSPLHKMDVKSIPKSARDFFSNAAKEANEQLHKAKENQEQEESSSSSTPATEQDTKPPTVRKLRKPKRKNRYNPRVSEVKSTTEANPEKFEFTSSTPTTPFVETTTEPRPTYMPTTNPNDINKDSSVFKPRSPLLPKALPELSKSLLNGKIDIKKLNATISTSVSVSGSQEETPEGGQNSNKRVFSSQNGGGLSVVRGGQNKRKRQKQKADDGGDANKAKYEIAASVLDIIKATTETEKNGAGFYSNRYEKMDLSTPSPLSEAWVSNPVLMDIDYKRRES